MKEVRYNSVNDTNSTFEKARSRNVVNALIIDAFESHDCPPEANKLCFHTQTTGLKLLSWSLIHA